MNNDRCDTKPRDAMSAKHQTLSITQYLLCHFIPQDLEKQG